MLLECRHIKPNGVKCMAPALRGKPYCYFHSRLHAYAARPPRSPDEPLKLPVLEDRSSIQIALAQVLDALGASHLEPRRAGLFLYALQIASQNVEQDKIIVPISAVHSMTVSRSGDELAPESFTCPLFDDCSTCDERDNCKERDLEEDRKTKSRT